MTTQDRRKKDISWRLDVNPTTGSVSHEDAKLAVLMDIRDQLKDLNQHLRCHNFVQIPHILRAIRANTHRRKYKKKQ